MTSTTSNYTFKCISHLFTCIFTNNFSFRNKRNFFFAYSSPFENVFANTYTITTVIRFRWQRPYYTKEVKIGEAAIDSFNSFYGNELYQIANKMLKKKMDSDPSDSFMLYVFHLPLRSAAKTTGGMITENMTKDIQYMLNGHGFAGLCQLIGHNFSDKKKIKAYRAKLEK